ncbi:MAG: ABC transporter permease [Vicinamibacterales bacterium]|nr:ABC transporter permease [Vicinamibacterales bacterium]MDP7671701.1 ABC transporter permease [Vicinamibacterales bacterium]HJO39148.1 ABC transporter permease [Vicinamibacterales bacterium]
MRAVGVTQSLPFFGDYVLGYRVEGRPEPEPGQMPLTNHYVVTPGYFEAMGITLRRGRFFTDLDREDGVPVLLINETMARQEFPDEDPIGQRIHVTHGQGTVGPRDRRHRRRRQAVRSGVDGAGPDLRGVLATALPVHVDCRQNRLRPAGTGRRRAP